MPKARFRMGLGVRGKMILLVAIPFVLCVTLLGFVVVSGRISIRASEQVMLWTNHSSAVWEVEITADRYLDRLDDARSPRSLDELRIARAALLRSTELSHAAGEGFSEAEQESEGRLRAAVLELIRRGDQLRPGGNHDRLAELRAFYRDEVIPNIERRLAEESEGLHAAMAVSRRWNDWLALGALITTFTIVLGGLGACLLIASRLSNGLRALAGRASSMGAGEAVDPVALRQGDELGALATSFNEMAAALQRQRRNRFNVLASVAHDLRNPLQALKMLSQSLPGPSPSVADLERAMNVVRRQVGRMDRLIEDLVDASRIESGELELQLDSCDLVELARESVELYRATAPRHQVTLREPGQPVVVRCDSTRITQVLNNLISNAIKYSPAGGPVQVRLEGGEDGALLEVSDRGVGIPPEDRTRIFDPFERLSSGMGLADGTGLGLAISKRIVAAHRGELGVDSQVGKGSVFRVRLP